MLPSTPRLMAVMRSDIVESTPFQLRVGDAAAIDAFSGHLALIEAVTTNNGGSVTARAGDGLFAIFDSMSAAVRAAQQVQAANQRRNRWHADHQFDIRIGVSAGELAADDHGELYGRPLLEAERLQSAATGGQILCTARAAELTAGRVGTDITPAGEAELKGFDQPVPVCTVTWDIADNPLAVLAPTLEREPSTSFVGRSWEYRQLEQFWEEAARGHPHIVIVQGEAGIGKSRLARELVVGVSNTGALTGYAPCYPDDDQPYGPLSRALDHFSSGLAGRPQQLGPNGADLASLIPDFGIRFPSFEPQRPDDIDFGSERRKIQRAITSWLSTITQEEPLLLLIEDLQWADERTMSILLQLTEHVSRERLLVVATVRSWEAPAAEIRSQLGRLVRSEVVSTMTLGGLKKSETVSLVEDMAGHSLTTPFERRFAERIWKHTDGNPLFVQAVLRHLAATGGLEQIDGRWVASANWRELTSPEVREAVKGQLGDLTDTEQLLLRAAAALGSEFSLSTLRNVSKRLGLEDLAAIDVARAAGLIHDEPSDADRCRFSHEIVRSVFLSDLSEDEVARVHDHAANALIDAAGGIDNVDRGLLSYHLSFSDDATVQHAAARHAIDAGHEAMHAGAFEQANTLFTRAIGLLHRRDGPFPINRPMAEALVGAGTAANKTGDPSASTMLDQAIDMAEQLGDGELLARAALATHPGIFAQLGAVSGSYVRSFERALELMGSDPSELRSVVLASLGVELTYADQPERQAALLSEAEAMARSLHDPKGLARVLVLKGNALWRPNTLADRRSLAAQLSTVEDAATLGWRFGAANFGCQTAMEAGDIATARRKLAQMEELAARIDRPTVWWTTHVRRCNSLATAGDLEAADEAASQAIRFGREAGTVDLANLYYFANQWMIRYHRGDLDGITDIFEAAAAAPYPRPVLKPALAAIHAEGGRLDECGELLEDVDEKTFALVDQDLLVTAAVTAIAANAVEDRERADLAWQALDPYRAQMIDNTSTHFGSTLHYLGLCAATLGRVDEAHGLLKEAELQHRRIESEPLVLRSNIEAARVIVGHDGTSSSNELRSDLNASYRLATSRGLGRVASLAAETLELAG